MGLMGSKEDEDFVNDPNKIYWDDFGNLVHGKMLFSLIVVFNVVRKISLDGKGQTDSRNYATRQDG